MKNLNTGKISCFYSEGEKDKGEAQIPLLLLKEAHLLTLRPRAMQIKRPLSEEQLQVGRALQARVLKTRLKTSRAK